MKKIFKKVHHFTRTELAIEEIVIIVIICLLCSAALAAKALLPIRAGIVQCGTRAELSESCRRDTRCCALMEKSGSPSDAIETMHDMDAPEGEPVETINDDAPVTTVE